MFIWKLHDEWMICNQRCICQVVCNSLAFDGLFVKCQPFTHLLKKDQNFRWDLTCPYNFELIKQYLANLPILVPPIPGCPLILYITSTPTALGALLAQLDDTRKERAIYYISQTLVGYELNYTPIEKACLALVFSTQKL